MMSERLIRMTVYGCLGDRVGKVFRPFLKLSFQLPMHPLFLKLYQTFGCGVGQISPNALVQVSGVIVRCRELGEDPT